MEALTLCEHFGLFSFSLGHHFRPIIIIIIISTITNESGEPWSAAMAFQIGMHTQVVPGFVMARACRPPLSGPWRTAGRGGGALCF